MKDLLEYIFQRAECTYISDLPNSLYRSTIIDILESTPEDMFDLNQWNSVYRYITHSSASFPSKAEILHQLKHMDNNKSR